MSELAKALDAALDRREYPRVPVALPAKLSVPADDKMWVVRVTNLSVGGAGLEFREKPPAAELIGTLDIERFGNFDGITIRREGNLAGLRFLIGEAERHHLTQCLTALIRSGLQSVQGHSKDAATAVLTLTRQSGSHHLCTVEDISLNGVALSADFTVPPGEHVLVGQMHGRVVVGPSGQVVVQFLGQRKQRG